MHRHHQEVLLLYQSYIPVKCSPSVRTLTVLTACRYQVGNTMDVPCSVTQCYIVFQVVLQ